MRIKISLLRSRGWDQAVEHGTRGSDQQRLAATLVIRSIRRSGVRLTTHLVDDAIGSLLRRCLGKVDVDCHAASQQQRDGDQQRSACLHRHIFLV